MTSILRNLQARVIKLLTFILKLLYYISLYFIKYKEIDSCSVTSPMIFLGLKLSSRKLVLSTDKGDPAGWESELISEFKTSCSTVIDH